MDCMEVEKECDIEGRKKEDGRRSRRLIYTQTSTMIHFRGKVNASRIHFEQDREYLSVIHFEKKE